MFSKSAKTPDMAKPHAASGGSTFSVLGADLTITGDIEASEDLHVDGSVEGDISCGSLVQGESSTIGGAVRADTARLAGTVEGAITAKSLVILKSARIAGDVFYDTLTIEQGATVEGKFARRAADGKSAGSSSDKDAEPKLTLAN